jgi:hypothetical protein
LFLECNAIQSFERARTVRGESMGLTFVQRGHDETAASMQRNSWKSRFLSLIPHSNHDTASFAASRAGSLFNSHPRSPHHLIRTSWSISISIGPKQGFVMPE